MAAITAISESDILAEEFPDNVSVSALCDCGRHRRLHNHAVFKPPSARAPMPETDYKSTFKMTDKPRPRSSKRPPPSPRDPCPPPMIFDTNQRLEFKPIANYERVKPIIHEEHYKPPTVPLESTTFYSQEFTPKESVPEMLVVSRRDTLRAPGGPFESRTTNKEAFKHWLPQPGLSFGELPSFTGSILFPEKKPLPVSTMRNSYQGIFVPPVSLIKAGLPNIKLEGSHVFDTTHNETYKEIKGDHRVKPIVHKATTSIGKRDKFSGETQSKADFPGFGTRQPPPPRPAEPAPATINLKFDNKRSFVTENRAIYKGHDVKQHPVVKSCKVEEGEYKQPDVKFETETSQKRDYKPIDLASVQIPKAVAPTTNVVLANEAFFDGRTMNNEFFKNWGAKPRVRYGDFHENRPYLGPMHPFEGESVTSTTFVPKKLEPVTFFKPVERPNSKAGKKVDYTTSYSEEFQKKQMRMCRAQVYLLQQELKRKQREGHGAHSAKAIAVK